MGMYYSNALLTLAACEKNNCDGGLFFTRPKCETVVTIPYIDYAKYINGSLFARRERATFEDAVVHSPHENSLYDWWNRGWTVQERLMSRRMV